MRRSFSPLWGPAMWLCCLGLWGCDKADSASQPAASGSAVTMPEGPSSVVVPADDATQADVRKQLEAYKAAVWAKDGDAAASLVSLRTIRFFDETRKLALYAGAEALKQKPVFDQMLVLMLRARVPIEELENSDGRAIFARGVHEGWTGAVARNFGAGPIKVTGETAVLMSQTKPWAQGDVDEGFRAYREDGAWKLDVIAVASLAAKRMDAQLAKLDPDPQRALVLLMEKMMGRKLPADIWDAPRKE